jgi:hypothetical protein
MNWQLLDFESVLIIGNGPGDLPPDTDGRPYVTFNRVGSVPLRADEIRVVNRKEARLSADDRPFVVTGECFPAGWCRQFEASLVAAAAELEALLGCLPSTGLATVYALSDMEVPIALYRMPLRPSLLRMPNMSARKPLAAAFHNWLGERRLALQWWNDLPSIWSWSQRCLPVDNSEQARSGASDPFPTLWQWFAENEGESAWANTDTLQGLAALPATTWCMPVSAAQLRALERFFFLSRQQRNTPNWWLYRNELSPFIDTLLLRLMQAQQRLAYVPVAS